MFRVLLSVCCMRGDQRGGKKLEPRLHRERAGGNLFTSGCHTSDFVEKRTKHGRERYIVHYGCRVPEHRARALIRPEFQTNNTMLAWRQKS